MVSVCLCKWNDSSARFSSSAPPSCKILYLLLPSLFPIFTSPLIHRSSVLLFLSFPPTAHCYISSFIPPFPPSYHCFTSIPPLHYFFQLLRHSPLSHFSGESLLLNPDTSPLRSSPMVAACSMKALFIDLCGPLFQYQPICDQETSDAVSGLEQHLSFHCMSVSLFISSHLVRCVCECMCGQVVNALDC